MTTASFARLVDLDLPSPPDVMTRLSLLLADDDFDMKTAAALIENDMALAAAVVKAVNSPLYGVNGRVQSVQQAITYLGMREVTAVVYELGLRSVFPNSAEIDALWKRASVRGLLMGRIGQQLNVDPWGAHSAGLFEECGKALLFRHSRDRYLPLLQLAPSDRELRVMETAEFGVAHDELGALLCEHWGLSPAVVASVRHHVEVQASRELPAQVPRRSLCALSALVHALMTSPDDLEDVVAAVAPQALLDETLMLRGARQVHERLEPGLLH
ncbi:MAG: histidine kinase [Rhizobacter sp.]|jgi:HD-like signal output (HDOD) protein|nr:histidine kinase [Rhizobacter sp.]